MKAFQSPLLKRMLQDTEARAQLTKFIASGQLSGDIFFKGKYYTFKRGEFA